ncbi:hypothetical protein V3C99_014812 [Haemonchus contortus]
MIFFTFLLLIVDVYGNSVVSEHYCPGGGSVVIGYDGKLSTCDMLRQCGPNQICNPQCGLCCTKLRTCPRPAKTMLNAITGKPVMCQIKFGPITPCPDGGYCETKTGFCCKSDSIASKPFEEKYGGSTPSPVKSGRPFPVSVRTLPWRGQLCLVRDGCDGGAACTCDNGGKCRCECPTELGYTIAADGKTCKRVRRRLKEKCKTDMECSSAFSECTTGGCRCRKGFQRDGRDGCKPISYKCVNNGQPLMISEKIVSCSMRSAAVKLMFSSQKRKPMKAKNTKTIVGTNSSLSDWNKRDDCPHEYYCVPLFDDATKPGFYEGFCCPLPGENHPVCPVGEPHETSSPPDYGCDQCPMEYYCHRDAVFTNQPICCPKPCISMEDIYYDGQCYATAYYGDSCHISAQCSTSRNSTDEFSENSPLECIKGICGCRAGYSHIEGECKRVTCTIGMRGEPSVDRNNQLIRCARSEDCSQGHMCDPNTHVCCKGVNRCPKGYVENGLLCENDKCQRPGSLCFRAKTGKVKICCVMDNKFS